MEENNNMEPVQVPPVDADELNEMLEDVAEPTDPKLQDTDLLDAVPTNMFKPVFSAKVRTAVYVFGVIANTLAVLLPAVLTGTGVITHQQGLTILAVVGVVVGYMSSAFGVVYNPIKNPPVYRV